MANKKGKFIVVYGMNNLGKTTMVNRLVEFLKKENKEAVYLKYPIYDLKPTGPRINNYLRNGNPENLTSLEIQKLYVDNRRDFEPKLKKMISSGKWIIAEDYCGTGIAWGVIRGETLQQMEKINKGLLSPDLSILLDGERFLTGIETNHKNESDNEIWPKGREIHLGLAKKYDWKLVNANQNRKKVVNDVIDVFKKEKLL